MPVELVDARYDKRSLREPSGALVSLLDLAEPIPRSSSSTPQFPLQGWVLVRHVRKAGVCGGSVCSVGSSKWEGSCNLVSL